jgi:secreted Zn-dependent insulinase-like peptidase
VVDVILQHCRLIASVAAGGDTEDELRRIWTESIALRAMFFHQSSPGSVYDLVPNLANSVVKNGTRKSMCAGSMLEETAETFPLKQVADYSARLVLSNCFIERCSQQAWDEMEGLDGTAEVERKTEQWYNVDYFLSGFSEQDKAAWNDESGQSSFRNARSQLKLPPPNRYIPRTLELCPDLPEESKAGPRLEREIDPPHLLVENGRFRLWHRLDDRYALPKSEITILIRNAATNNIKENNGVWVHDTRAAVHSSLISGVFSEALAQETYDAGLAGLHWNLSLSASGICIRCVGFSDRLPDLALQILQAFLSGDFCTESHFVSTKDRVMRSLRTFFESRRADSHAAYYRDFLLSSVGSGVDDSLVATEAATLGSTKRHLQRIFENEDSFAEIFLTGNVSEREATLFFANASGSISKTTAIGRLHASSEMWTPASIERRLFPQEDIELHFSSKNLQEENGAVQVTFQSPIPGYRGHGLSSDESLRSSSAIRLLCQMVREPLFDELRTKQTLGYIVNSYYDVGLSSKPDELPPGDPFTVPVDYIVINVLGRKAAPLEVARRIDEFLVSFRQSLLNMPESEIQHHATSLCTKMLKPIQKLSEEASSQFGKILNFAPEVLSQKGRRKELPWNNSPSLAKTIASLSRADLLQTWDRLIIPENRARILSCVYGTTFPLPNDLVSSDMPRKSTGKRIVVVNQLDRILELRQRLAVFDPAVTPRALRSYFWSTNLQRNRTVVAGVATTVALGAVGWTLLTRYKKVSK